MKWLSKSHPLAFQLFLDEVVVALYTDLPAIFIAKISALTLGYGAIYVTFRSHSNNHPGLQTIKIDKQTDPKNTNPSRTVDRC